jgi:energy-coupling factor transporter transmembrane protein EcfT
MRLYVPRSGFVHGLAPATRIIGLLLVFAWVFGTSDLRGVLAILAGAAAMTLGSGGRRNLRAALGNGNSMMWALGPLRFTREGAAYGALVALRLAAMLIAGIAFLTTTSVETFAYGLRQLRVPYRPAFALATAFHLVPLLLEAARTTTLAQRSRGLDLESLPPWQRVRAYVPLLVPVILSAVRGVNHLSIALEARGFGASSARTSYIEASVKARDAWVLAVLTGLVSGTFAL